MRARFDGICVKCGGKLHGFQTSPDFAPDDIGWRRRGDTYGLPSVAWHTACKDMPDNMEVIRELQAKKHIPTSAPAPAPAPAPAWPKPDYVPPTPYLVKEPTMPHDSNIFQSLANEILPYLEGKVGANLETVNALVSDTLAGLESKLQSMIDNASRRVVIEDRITSETRDMGLQHKMYPELLKRVQHTRTRNFYLYGPAGSGKSSVGPVLAKALNLPNGYISLVPQTSESRVIGYMNANGEYVATQLRKIYENGGVYVIDEIDNASDNLLTALNSLLANGYGSFPDGLVPRHPDCIIIATGNTCGYGHNPMYPGRQQLSPATRDRYQFISWDYDETFERELAIAKASDTTKANQWVTWVQRVRAYAVQFDPKLPVSPRASIEGAELINVLPVESLAHSYIFRGYDKDSVSRILKSNPLPVF